MSERHTSTCGGGNRRSKTERGRQIERGAGGGGGRGGGSTCGGGYRRSAAAAPRPAHTQWHAPRRGEGRGRGGGCFRSACRWGRGGRGGVHVLAFLWNCAAELHLGALVRRAQHHVALVPARAHARAHTRSHARAHTQHSDGVHYDIGTGPAAKAGGVVCVRGLGCGGGCPALGHLTPTPV